MRKFSLFNKRSLTALTLSVAMVLGLVGCGKDDGAAGGTGGINPDVVYKAEYLDVPDMNSVVNWKETDGTLHILSAVYGEKREYKLCTYNLADGSTTEITMEGVTEDRYWSSALFNEDGSLEVIEIKEEYDEEWNFISREMYFNKYDANGTLVSSEDATEKLQLGEDAYISHFMKDEEGNYLIGSWDMPLSIYSPELVKTGEISTGSTQIDGLCMTQSGKVVASSWGMNGGVDVAVVDVAGKKLGTAINTEKTNGSATVWPGVGDTVLYMNGNQLYSCDVVTGETVVVMDIMDMDVNPDIIQSVYPLSDGSFLMFYHDWYSAGGGAGMFIAKPVDPSEVKERIELTVATIYTSQELNNAVIQFNQSNEEYRIKVVDYMTDDWDFEASLTNLQNDIVAGNVPDMIDMRGINMPWRNWAAKGILTDLYPLMEADGEYAKEDLLENVREAYEVDGSLYILPSTVTIQGILVKEKFVDGITTLSPSVLLEMEKTLPEDTDLFWYNYQGEIMYSMVYNNMDSWLDYEKGECYFNTDEFKAVLAYAKEQPAEMVWDDSVTLPGQLAADKIIFYNVGMSQMPDYQFNKYVFGEDITMIGYPGKDDDGVRIVTNGCAMSISEQCEHKDVAWQFIKTFISEEYQNSELIWGIPTTQAGLDNFIYEAQHMEGEHGYSWDDVEMSITDATDEEVAEFLAIVEKADELQYQDIAIQKIIEEEVAPYFEGQKSVDEVADIIQSRIDIYLKENL